MTRLDIVNKLKDIYKDNKVFNEVIVFGSTARGDFKDSSDIDIYFESTLPISRLSSCKEYRNLSDMVFNLLWEYNNGRSEKGYVEVDSLIINPSEVKSFKRSSIWGSIEKDGIVLWSRSNCNVSNL